MRLRWLVVLITLLSAFFMARAAWADSVTNDEGIYIRAGICAFNAGVVDLEPTNPAGMKLLAGLGASVAGVETDQTCTGFGYRALLVQPIDLSELRRLVFFARLPAIAVTVGLILVAAWWARQMVGPAAAVLAAALVGFEPSVMAHGHLATGDVPVTAGLVVLLACAWRWQRDPQRRWLLLGGLALGFALLNKASAVAFLPMVGGLLLVTAAGSSVKERVVQAMRASLAMGAVAYVTLIAVYAPFRNLQPEQDLLPRGLNWLLPQSWLWGVNWQRQRVASVRGSGALTYFPETIALKMTIAALVLALVGAVLLLLRRRTVAMWTLLPALALLLYTMASGVNIGVRYVLPTMALLLIGAAAGLGTLRPPLVAGSAAVAGVGAAAVLLGPVGSIGYVNALASGGGRDFFDGDSNIDWGQDGWRLRDWWERNGRPDLQVDYFELRAGVGVRADGRRRR